MPQEFSSHRLPAFTLAVSRRSPSTLFLTVEDRLAFELDLLRSTRGSVQRVTVCCWAPTTSVPPPSRRRCSDRLQFCSACGEEQDFATECQRIFLGEGKSNCHLASLLGEAFSALGYDCLAAYLWAARGQEICEEAYELLPPPEERPRFGSYWWHGELLSHTLSVPVRESRQR